MNSAEHHQHTDHQQLAQVPAMNQPESHEHVHEVDEDVRSDGSSRHPILGAPTLLNMVDMFPPWTVIALARDRKTKRLLSYKEIAERSGISMRTVCRMAKDVSWGRYDLATVSRVMEVCGFAPCHLTSQRRYLLRTVCTSAPFRILQRRKRRLKNIYRMVGLVSRG